MLNKLFVNEIEYVIHHKYLLHFFSFLESIFVQLLNSMKTKLIIVVSPIIDGNDKFFIQMIVKEKLLNTNFCIQKDMFSITDPFLLKH